MNTKILVAMPCNRRIKPQAMSSLLELIRHSKHDFDFLIATQGYTISENRNYIAVQTLNRGADYLFSIDDDMTFPPDTLDRMLAHDKDIVGVASHQKRLPLRSTVELLEEGEMPKELFECKAVGGGVLLVKSEVFKKVGSPWFDTTSNIYGLTMVGEDSYFCDKARERGYKIWCDPTIKIGHLGDYLY